ncbi:MAG: hypothetical protein AAGA60_30060, partial [Cyanobacteria bacterium P01_E01_bin.42]
MANQSLQTLRQRIKDLQTLRQRIKETRPDKEIIPPKSGQRVKVDDVTYEIGNPIDTEKGAFGDVYECFDDWQTPLVAKTIKEQTVTPEKYLKIKKIGSKKV